MRVLRLALRLCLGVVSDLGEFLLNLFLTSLPPIHMLGVVGRLSCSSYFIFLHPSHPHTFTLLLSS